MNQRTLPLLVLAGAGVVAVWVLVLRAPSSGPQVDTRSARPASGAAPAAAPAAVPGSAGRAGEGGGAAPDLRAGGEPPAPGGERLQHSADPARAEPTTPERPGLTVFQVPEQSGPGSPEPIVPESLARNALRLVGKDPAAEVVWERAINDPGLPPGARSDLIEDLNDEGFPDHKDLTAADIPLILARLRLIERLSPYAMDDVNSAAFAEAYKDLLAMLARLRGAGVR